MKKEEINLEQQRKVIQKQLEQGQFINIDEIVEELVIFWDSESSFGEKYSNVNKVYKSFIPEYEVWLTRKQKRYIKKQLKLYAKDARGEE